MWAAVSASAAPVALAVSEPRGTKQQYLFVVVVSGSRGIVPGYLLLVFPVQEAGCSVPRSEYFFETTLQEAVIS